VVGVAIALALGVCVWWILYDQRLPNGDDARHLATSNDFAETLRGWDTTGLLTTDIYGYPPLVRLVGAVPIVAGLDGTDWSPIAVAAVFLPLLALGCYGVGRHVFGPTAGVLAALFALGTPMVMQLFHVELLDAPLAAMVAVTLWALLASDRFARTRESAIAGALLGLALLVKTPAPAFLAGAVAVSLATGGWRRPRNVALAAAATLIVAAPYYLNNISQYASLSGEAVVASQDQWTLAFGWSFEGSRRLSPESFAWYPWAGVNTQYLVPLMAFFAAGLGYSLTQLRRRPQVAELVAGLAVGYLAMTLLSLHDPRYTLPLAVYVAVIGTSWITALRARAIRIAATVVLLAVVAANFAAGTFGALPTVQATLPGDDEADLIHPGALTFLDKRGFYAGEPHPDPVWADLLDTIEREGIHTAELHFYEPLLGGTDYYGFQVAAETEHDIDLGDAPPFVGRPKGIPGTLAHPGVVITTWWSSDPPILGRAGVRALPAPCASVEDGIVLPDVEGKQLHVLVERLWRGRYERWCDF